MGDEDKAAFYAPSPEECKQLAPHISRLAPRAEKLLDVPIWVHDAIVTSDDTVGLLMLVVSYLSRTGLLDKMVPGVIRTFSRKDKQGARPGQNIGSVQSQYNGNSNGNDPRAAFDPRNPEGYVPIDQINGLGGIGGQYS